MSNQPHRYHRAAGEFQILGPLEVASNDGTVEIGGPKERAALEVLAMHVGRTVSADRLIDALWGDDGPRSSTKALQNIILRLRRSLGPDAIETRPAGYVLVAEPDDVDAARFDRLVREGRELASRGEPEAAAVALQSALSLWRGDPLAELRDWSDAQIEIGRLEELRRSATEELADAELDAGRHQEWVARLETMAAEEPLRERRWVLLMEALYRCGRQTDALRAYQRARAVLSELGLEPGPELRAMEQAVTAHDDDAIRPKASHEPKGARLPTGVVTFLLTDIEDSSGQWDRAPQAMAEALERHDRIIERSVADAGGVLLKARGEGDSSFSVFDKTTAAVAAALAINDAIANEDWPSHGDIAVRTALHLGEAHERDGDYYGPTVNRAARLRSVATGGQIVLSESAAGLVRDELPEGYDLVELGEQALRGLSRPERVFALATSGAVLNEGDTLVARSCPYMGLFPFQPEDHRLYFGRDDAVASVIASVNRERFVALVGPSGSGKSSLLRAGVVAELRRSDGDSPGWLTVLMTPGARPLAELAAAVSALTSASPAALLRDLEVDPRALDLAMRQLLASQPIGAKAVVVVDQFEELFTLCRSERDRRHFVAALADTASPDHGASHVAISLRADFFGRCAQHPELVELLDGRTTLVGDMDEAGLRAAIEGPAKQLGLSLEPGLVDAMLRDVIGEPGGLPLLSHALLEVWTRRAGRLLTAEGYRASGGIGGAIGRTAERVYESLDAVHQHAAQRLFLRLTEPGEGTEDTRRRASRAELRAADESGDAPRAEVLDVLVAARLVTVDEDTVEIAHEALIRSWPRLGGWLDEDREGLRVMRHLTLAAQEWEARGCDDSELYRGPRLAAAVEWRTTHDSELNPLEREFIDAGAAREEFELETARTQARTERKQNKRLRALLAGTAVALIVALLAGLLALAQRDDADRSRDRADAAARSETVGKLVALSRTAQDDHLDLALLLANEANRLQDSPETRAAIQSALLSNPQLLGFLHGSGRTYESVAVLPSGGFLAGTLDGVIDRWGPDRRFAGATTIGAGPVSARVSLDGNTVATLTEGDGVVALWDPSTMQRRGAPLTTEGLRERTGPDKVVDAGLAFSPDGRVVSAPLASGEVATWDVASGAEVGPRLALAEPITHVAYSGDGRIIAVGTNKGSAAVFDAAGRVMIGQPFRAGGSAVVSVGLGNDGTNVAVGISGTETTVLFNRDTREEVPSSINGAQNGVIARSPDGTLLAVGSTDGTVRVVNASTGAELGTKASAHGGALIDIAFSPDGSFVATANANGTVSLIDISGQRKLGKMLPTEPTLQFGEFSPDSTKLAVLDQRDGSVALVDASDGRERRRLRVAGMGEIPPTVATSPAFSPDGSTVAIGDTSGHVTLFDAATGSVVRSLSGPRPGGVGTQVSFSRDGTWLVAGNQFDDLSTDVTLYEVATGTIRWTFPGATMIATNFAFTPDDRSVIVSGYGGSRLVDTATGQQQGRDIEAPTGVWVVENGPVGTVVVGATDGSVRVVDIASREQRGSTMQAGLTATTLNLLAGGTQLAVGINGSPGTVQVFDLASGRLVGRPFPSAGLYGAASVNADMTRLLTNDGFHLVVWNLDSSSWAGIACEVAARNLTQEEWSQYLPNAGPYHETCPI